MQQQEITVMNYKEAIEYINKTQKFGIRPGLEAIEMLLNFMGNPQKMLKYVHVAGTNGKGSTVSFISSVLIEAGYKVGIFTSPSIQRFSEKIRVNHTEIPECDIARIISSMKEKIELILRSGGSSPTEFEIITALAFQYFAEQGCDLVVLEAGLGGRLDSTNIIGKPEVAVITTINYDHMDVLGDTLTEIASEKAGIIKEECDVVLYPQEQDVQTVVDQVCERQGAKLHKVDFSSLQIKSFDFQKQKFDYEAYTSLETSLLGDHQIKNAAIAIKTIEVLQGKGYRVNEQIIRKGLSKAKWPGRFEMVNQSPVFLVDGAHNVQGVLTLNDNLKKLFPGKKVTFMIGVLSDKDYKAMIRVISPIAKSFITVTPNNSRALKAQDLKLFLESHSLNALACESTEEAIRMCLKFALPDEIICAFGSLYYIGEIRKYFTEN
jgi:dihydrofolate synthase/folylpolyglutamate synthase